MGNVITIMGLYLCISVICGLVYGVVLEHKRAMERHKTRLHAEKDILQDYIYKRENQTKVPKPEVSFKDIDNTLAKTAKIQTESQEIKKWITQNPTKSQPLQKDELEHYYSAAQTYQQTNSNV